MKSYLFAVLFAVTSLVTASSCAVDPDDADLATEESMLRDDDVVTSANPLFQADGASATNPIHSNSDNPLYQAVVTPNGEEVWWRCSTTRIAYPNKPFCQSECPGGTCRIALVCTDDSTGQQIPCP
jgi:hypothetical protein